MSWIGWQIDFLLFLQNFREMSNHVFDWFFMNITKIGIGELSLILMYGIYWCINKKIGSYIIHSYCLSYLANIFLKLSFCIYRPWILDPRVKPLDGAIHTAPGYSFPSGHTSGVTSCYGSIAAAFWKNKWIVFICLFMIFSVMFSRMYLGVHTPQDVIFSFIVTVSIVLGTKKLFEKFEKDEKYYNYFIVSLGLLCLALIFYILFKNYPMDIVNGEILYDPTRAKLHAAAKIFNLFGIMFGCFLESKFIKFDPAKGHIVEKVLRIAIGLYIFHLIDKQGTDFLRTFCDPLHARCITYFISGIFLTFIYPILIKYIPSISLPFKKKA